MMSKSLDIYALDTDHCTVLQRGGDGYNGLTARLRAIAPDDYGTTIVSYEEQFKGWLDRLHRVNTSALRIEAYTQLQESLRFYSGLAVWEYTTEADAEYTRLVKAKVRVRTKDLLIASIALANNATVLTRNARDFGKIPGLKFEDWTV